MTRLSRFRRQNLLALPLVVLMVASFQNCSPMGSVAGGGSDSTASSSVAGNPSPSPAPSLAPNPSPQGVPSPLPSPAPAPNPAPSTQPPPTRPPVGGPISEPPHTNGPSPYLADPMPSGRVLKVCPSGCTYTAPSQALDSAVLMDGDVVEIDGGDYVDCAYITKNNITVRGVSVGGLRPHIHDKTCGRKGIFVIDGQSILIDNIEFSGAVDSGYGDNNWAGIRIDAGAGSDVIVRNSYFHECDNGILGGAVGTGTQLVENSKFENLGRAGYAHGMYVGMMGKFILRNSIVISNRDDGHLVKSRAQANIIECNMIAGLNGVNSYAVDLPQGGDDIVRNNVIQNGPNANNTHSIVNFAEENRNNSVQSFSVHDNVIINDKPSADFFWIVGSPTLNGWANNTLIGPNSPFDSGGASVTSGFSQTTRAAAGLPAFDGTLSSLPAPPFCP